MPIKRTPLAALRAAIAASGEVLPGGFGLSLSGRHRVTVSGCRRILRYGEEEIALRVGGEVLRITGSGLLCVAFGAGSVTVTGRIAALSFEEVES